MSQIPEKPERNNNNETASESQSVPVPEQTPQTPPPQTSFQTSDAKTSEHTTIIPTSSSASHSIQIPPAIYNAHSSPDSNYANIYTYKYGNVHFQPSAEPPPPYSSVVPARASTSSRPHIVNITEEGRRSEGRQRKRQRQDCSPIPRWVIVLIVIILIPLIISITSVKVSGKDPFDGTYGDANEPKKQGSMT